MLNFPNTKKNVEIKLSLLEIEIIPFENRMKSRYSGGKSHTGFLDGKFISLSESGGFHLDYDNGYKLLILNKTNRLVSVEILFHRLDEFERIIAGHPILLINDIKPNSKEEILFSESENHPITIIDKVNLIEVDKNWNKSVIQAYENIDVKLPKEDFKNMNLLLILNVIAIYYCFKTINEMPDKGGAIKIIYFFNLISLASAIIVKFLLKARPYFTRTMFVSLIIGVYFFSINSLILSAAAGVYLFLITKRRISLLDFFSPADTKTDKNIQRI